MPHRLEPSPTGRARCRACKRAIEKAELRFAEASENAFGDGESYQYYHLSCAAERRSESFQAMLESDLIPSEAKEELARLASLGVAHPRWTRVASIERASTGRAKCRECKEAIAVGTARLCLEYYEEGRLSPSGFLHPSCLLTYAGSTVGIEARLLRNGATEDLLDECRKAFQVS